MSFLQDFAYSFVWTVNALKCLQSTPVPDVAFTIDVLENKQGGCKGLNFIKKCQGCPEKVFLQCLQGITEGKKMITSESQLIISNLP